MPHTKQHYAQHIGSHTLAWKKTAKIGKKNKAPIATRTTMQDSGGKRTEKKHQSQPGCGTANHTQKSCPCAKKKKEAKKRGGGRNNRVYAPCTMARLHGANPQYKSSPTRSPRIPYRSPRRSPACPYSRFTTHKNRQTNTAGEVDALRKPWPITAWRV